MTSVTRMTCRKINMFWRNALRQSEFNVSESDDIFSSAVSYYAP